MSDIYDNICEVRIQTEGYQGGYVVRLVEEDDTKVYHLSKDDLIGLVKQIQETAESKGTVNSHWLKVA